MTPPPSAGHSRSIVGLEQKRNGTLALLLLDPDTSAADVRKLLSGDTVSAAARHVRRFPGSLKHQQYQVVAVHGVMTAEERRVSVCVCECVCVCVRIRCCQSVLRVLVPPGQRGELQDVVCRADPVKRRLHLICFLCISISGFQELFKVFYR